MWPAFMSQIGDAGLQLPQTGLCYGESLLGRDPESQTVSEGFSGLHATPGSQFQSV